MTDSSIPLEYPDYRRLSRAGNDGRILEPRMKEAPKIFSPFIVRVSVELGKSRNGVGLSTADMMDVAETCLGLSEDNIIDVTGDDRDSFEVVLREPVSDDKLQVGQTFGAPRYDVTLTVQAVEDTSDDNSESRRERVNVLVTSDPQADAIQITLPQTWLIPDPEFRPRLSVLPLFPGSFWLQFFKICWGHVQAATIVFGQDGAGYVGLVVQFREAKAMRQCVLTLFERYLVHPKDGMGMKMPRVRLARYSTVAAKRQIAPSKQVGFVQQRPASINEKELVMRSASVYANSKDEPMEVSEAFQKMLERVEKLDRENQRLLSLLVDEQDQERRAGDFISLDSSATRERSPRRREIPTTGLPPWRAPK